MCLLQFSRTGSFESNVITSSASAKSSSDFWLLQVAREKITANDDVILHVLINVIAAFQVWRIRDVVVHPEDDDLMANQNNRHANVVKREVKDVLNYDGDRGDKGCKM